MVRWRIGLNRISTLIGDLFFSIIALLVLFYFAQTANYLELRFYLFGGSLLGLLLYLRFISRQVKWTINKILSLIAMIFESLFKAIGSIITGVARLLTCLMSFPYGVLRWLALLFFRIVEAMGKDTYSKVRTRIGKTPRE
ncbi:MAG: hypothetical protein APF84_06620 [Gracilibacter sp. BRH_c7a]|nr:MAG: hypothetical protein APF84_06620 [Gracilibacter sp. BRH_c7a]